MSFAESVSYCDQHGGNVILPTNKEQNEFVQKLLTGINIDKIWIGMFFLKIHKPEWIIGNESKFDS